MSNVFDPDNKLESDCCKNGVYEEKDGTVHCGACTEECSFHEKIRWYSVRWMVVFKTWFWAYVASLIGQGIISFMYGEPRLGYYQILVAFWVGLYILQTLAMDRNRDLIDRLFNKMREINITWSDFAMEANKKHGAEKRLLLKKIEELKAKK